MLVEELVRGDRLDTPAKNALGTEI